MKLYTQMALESELLEPAPFKMELVMEAFLVENPMVLSLDGDSAPCILKSEMHLEKGRGDKNGRIDILAKYSDKKIAIVELKRGLIDIDAYEQLKDYLSASNIAAIKKEYDAKDSGFCGVLVGTQISDEVEKLLSEKHDKKDSPMAAIVLNRYKNPKTGQFFVTTDHYGENSGRDTSEYWFNGATYNKRRLILAVVKYVVNESRCKEYKDLAKIFSGKILNRAIKKVEDISEKSKRNYFMDDIIKMADGTNVAVCSDWGGKEFDIVVNELNKKKEIGLGIVKV